MRVAAALVAVLLLAGCGSSGSGGGGAKHDYEQALRAVVPGIQGDLLKRRFALQESRGPANARRLLARTEAQLSAAIAKLAAQKPPADVASAHAQLVTGYRTELGELHALDPLAHEATTDKLRVAAAKLVDQPGNRAVGTALQAIIAKGYDIGLSS